VVVVVTRYFGGTKLGTGGLVRAYSEAVRSVLRELPRAQKVPTHTVFIELPYYLYERIQLLVEAYHGQITDQDFGVQVSLTARFAVEHLPQFQAALSELSRGQIQAEIIETNENTIMPVDVFQTEEGSTDE
jgi:putative IMPACT (imprinted ancient) family translation regulator